MIALTKLNDYLESYLLFDTDLDVGKIDPFMTNGLMIKGKEDVKKIGFAVSASVELFRLAVKENCDSIIVHHSFNMPKTPSFDEIFQNRIAILLKNNISLFGYHFLLDAHPEVGNNVAILKQIGAKPQKHYCFKNQPWGFVGEFEKEQDLNEIKKLLVPFFSKRCEIYDYGAKYIHKVVALSGKGAPVAGEMQKLIDEKVDLYITGEAHEWNRELFREAKIHFIAFGHYHSEVFGINALMKKIKTEFPQVKTKWLELPNEV